MPAPGETALTARYARHGYCAAVSGEPSSMHRLPTLPLLALALGLGLATRDQPPLPAPAPVPAHQPNRPVEAVNLQRYAGMWYEIARVPIRQQRKCVGDTTALYTPLSDGTMAVRNRCRTQAGRFLQADGEARAVDGSSARLQVRFAPGWLSWLSAVWGDYWVIALDPGYQWAMVGSGKADTLWILSRTPTMDPRLREELVAKAARMGYPVQRLVLTPQQAGGVHPMQEPDGNLAKP